jgi:hypothetical protein
MNDEGEILKNYFNSYKGFFSSFIVHNSSFDLMRPWRDTEGGILDCPLKPLTYRGILDCPLKPL